LSAAVFLAGTLALAGCASDTATVSPPEPTVPPSPTPTIGLAVDITSVATPVPTVRPTPTPTRFVAPAGPWMLLAPDHGPPMSRNITVVAGNLPARAPITVSWSPGSRGAPLTLEVLTGPHGNLRTPFSIPAAPPGTYRVTIAAQGSLLGTARYQVVSRASLVASVTPSPQGDAIAVRGVRFIPNTRLLLTAYPLFRRARPLTLGVARTDGKGRFQFQIVRRKIPLGEYQLNAYSVGTLAAQVAQTYFQVSV
jgi:hypothetical protein